MPIPFNREGFSHLTLEKTKPKIFKLYENRQTEHLRVFITGVFNVNEILLTKTSTLFLSDIPLYQKQVLSSLQVTNGSPR